MTTGKIDPPLTEIASLRQPLTSGELIVFEYFRTNLGKDWEIYVQPHLNGLRPDFVLLNPRTGIAVFEVKDWDLSAMRYYYKGTASGVPHLFGHDGKREFSLRKSDPVARIELYKSAIYGVFCPRLDPKKGFGLITGGLIFPYADFSEIQSILAPARDHYQHSQYAKWNTLIGRDDLERPRSIKKALPCVYQSDNLRMDERHATDLRHWLVEPEFSREQRVPLTQGLDDRQRELVNTKPDTRFRRIRGPAGSGKSVVLAARAAKLAAEGKQVLLVTFNITLINYLLDYAVRYRQTGKVRHQIEAWNFHYWCKVIAGKTGHWDDYDDLWRQNDPGEVLAYQLANSAAHWTADLDQADRYDAIFVDEGQDFRLGWWNALRSSLAEGGEMLLCADRAQNIYGVSQAWTDNPASGSGLSSRWVELHKSYRMPRPLCVLAGKFLETFLPDAENPRPIPSQEELNLETERLTWAQVKPGEEELACYRALLVMCAKSDPPIAISDLTLIVDNANVGRAVMARLLDERQIRCIDTLEPAEGSELEKESEGRRKKLAFFKGDARVKVTTMHSFKGWESRALVVLISHADSNEALSLAYAGITRLKRTQHGSYLTVICSAPLLANYGKAWPH